MLKYIPMLITLFYIANTILFKNWFGNDIEQKVVESAIVFWFKDADAKSENKLVEYFREY